MNHLPLLVLGLSLAAAGCAGTASAPSPVRSGASDRSADFVAVDENGDKLVCRKERPTGSNIAELQCKRVAASERDRLLLQDQLRNVRVNAQSKGQ